VSSGESEPARVTAESPDANRALFDHNPLPMWVYDSETLRFLAVNDAAVAQYGFSRRQFLRMTILDLRPPEDRAALGREVPHLAGELKIWAAPWRHLRKDGSVCLVRIASHPLLFGGRPARLVVAQDITETTRAADEVRESSERYRFFIGRTAEGVWRAAVEPPVPVDAPEDEQVERCILHARLVEVNDAMLRMYGAAAPDELVGMLLSSSFDLADPRSVEFFRAFVRRRYRAVELDSLEFDRTGAPHWFVNNLVGVVEEGLLSAIWGTQRDVTEHRASDELVRATRDRLEAVVEASPLAIVVLDVEGNVTGWNHAAETMFGWAAEECLGVRLPCVPEDRQTEYDTFRGEVLGGRPFTGRETMRLRKDGTRIDVSISTAPLHDAEGRPIGLVALYQDVSGRKRAEEALRQSQEQLRQAQKMEAVGRLAGGIAHDLNNLLSAILSYSELVMADLPESHPSRDDLEQIRQAGNRAAELTHQLLAFSRRQLLQLRPLNLNAIVAGVDRMLRRVIGEDIELRAVLARAQRHPRRCRAARAGAHEPGRQRPRRHALGRDADHHHRRPRYLRDAPSALAAARLRTLRDDDRRGHRRRHDA